MRALTLDGFDQPLRLRDDIPAPELGDEEALIRVQASSVNPVDTLIAMGAMRGRMEYHFPVILGRDLAGAVEQVGPAVARHRVGDEVYGFLPVTGVLGENAIHAGTMAEYVAVPEGRAITQRPSTVSVAEAGAVPVAGIAALLCVDALDVSQGDRVLIVGATGGVGSFATQFAALRGAHVITPAFSEDQAYLRGLRAAEVIDRDACVARQVRARYPNGIDGLIDVVNRDPAAFGALASTLRPGGRAASPLGAADPDADGFVATNVMGAPEPTRLAEIAGSIDAGRVRVPIQRTYSLAQTPRAFDDLHARHARGKLAVMID